MTEKHQKVEGYWFGLNDQRIVVAVAPFGRGRLTEADARAAVAQSASAVKVEACNEARITEMMASYLKEAPVSFRKGTVWG